MYVCISIPFVKQCISVWLCGPWHGPNHRRVQYRSVTYWKDAWLDVILHFNETAPWYAVCPANKISYRCFRKSSTPRLRGWLWFQASYPMVMIILIDWWMPKFYKEHICTMLSAIDKNKMYSLSTSPFCYCGIYVWNGFTAEGVIRGIWRSQVHVLASVNARPNRHRRQNAATFTRGW